MIVKIGMFAAAVAVLAMAGGSLLSPSSAKAEEVESTLAYGGKLYDKWYAVIKAKAPKKSHPLYPTEKKYADKPASNWRCKECHGWDYMGRDGAYKSGKHASGIKGISAAAGKPVSEIVAALSGAEHGFADKLAKADLEAVALFVSKGQVDMDSVVDRASKKPNGDAAKGVAYYNTLCAGCHGKDGKLPKDMKPFGAQMGNPWEVMHKILNGQPGEQMPALRALPREVVADIMAHMTTLPKE